MQRTPATAHNCGELAKLHDLCNRYKLQPKSVPLHSCLGMAPILKLACGPCRVGERAGAREHAARERKLALQEFGIAAAGVLGGATLFAPPAEALTQAEKDALYQEFKAKKERKQDLRRANSYSDKARGANLAGSLPDEDLAAKLADKAGAKQMKSLARGRRARRSRRTSPARTRRAPRRNL